MWNYSLEILALKSIEKFVYNLLESYRCGSIFITKLFHSTIPSHSATLLPSHLLRVLSAGLLIIVFLTASEREPEPS